jgi:hypothetical protein
MEELWDRLLIHYLKEGRELLYGLATDDAHNYLEYGKSFSNPGRGWIMVRAGELSAAAIIQAMEKGDFYSTTGVVLEDIAFENRILKVQVKETPGVSYTIQFIGANSDGSVKEGKIFKEVKGTAATYVMTKDDLYVRARIISSKPKENPYHEGDLETAWTQPVK